jgi:hypothetical protein
VCACVRPLTHAIARPQAAYVGLPLSPAAFQPLIAECSQQAIVYCGERARARPCLCELMHVIALAKAAMLAWLFVLARRQ